MTERHHVTLPRFAMIARRPFTTPRQFEPPHDVLAPHTTLAVDDWRRLRTIVDALLRRAAGSTGDATVIAAYLGSRGRRHGQDASRTGAHRWLTSAK